jgi:ribosomal protein L7/L12
MALELEIQSLQKDNAQLRQRVAKLERTVEFLLNHLNITYVDAADTDQYAEITALVMSGNKIEAIKRYREMTGVGLAEAKNFIDKI